MAACCRYAVYSLHSGDAARSGPCTWYKHQAVDTRNPDVSFQLCTWACAGDEPAKDSNKFKDWIDVHGFIHDSTSGPKLHAHYGFWPGCSLCFAVTSYHSVLPLDITEATHLLPQPDLGPVGKCCHHMTFCSTSIILFASG